MNILYYLVIITDKFTNIYFDFNNQNNMTNITERKEYLRRKVFISLTIDVDTFE
ncbi:hypothetical protein PIROE2DRAFT_15445 [Piromyces sp. E2]|nr:hypothetical protein PIROE2DRAFT_15445 [Piromyces sp. E2]|eukprot:OUM59115.1 hypothetical protein PIROE2DRAFT_15445 [Piromyces sp. E2]